MRFICFVFLLFGLPWCGLAQDHDLSATGEFFPGGWSNAKAMNLIYGTYDLGSKSSFWTPKQSAIYEQYWPDQVRVRSLIDFYYVEAGVPKHLLVTWAKPDESDREEFSCHACAVLLGVVAFRQVECGWKADASDLQLTMIGAWGEPPTVKPLRLGRGVVGLVVQTDDIHQGEVEEHLWIFGPKSNGFKQWLDTDLADLDPNHELDETCRGLSESDMDGTCVWYRETYSLVPRKYEEMYELVLKRRIMRSFSKLHPVGTTTKRFRFDGTQYVEVGDSSKAH